MKDNPSAQHILKKIWVVGAVFFILFALSFAIFRALTPWAKQYKPQIENQLSELIGQPVKIQDLETGWYWFQPVLKMQGVELSDDKHRQMIMNQLFVGVNLWRSLLSWQIQPGILSVRQVTIGLHQLDDNQWDIDGIQPNQTTRAVDQSSYLPILGWLLSQDTVMLQDVTLNLYLQDGTLLPLKHVALRMRHSNGRVKISGKAHLDQQNPTYFSLAADLDVNPSSAKKVSGHLYLAVEHFIPSQWQNLVPHLPVQIKRGNCDLKFWFDLSHGQVRDIQSIVRLNDLFWTEVSQNKDRQLDRLSGNFFWKRTTKNGWHLAADHLHLQLKGINWPENTLQLDYTNETDTYSLFIKNILLTSLRDAELPWPESIQNLLAKKPEGVLLDTQVNVKQDQVSYMLTRFTDMGWEATTSSPAIKHISGVLYWEPQEGRLSLDGEKTTISPVHLPSLTFDLLNTDIAWKALSNGYRISMDRFVVSHPNLVVSANGVLDHPKMPDARIQLTAEFSAKNAKKLMVYLPSQFIKDKLDVWLKNDIKRIGHASGRIILNGKLDDFPFDHQPGEFSVVSHLSGVDLQINSDWPLNRDIDADLIVEKRNLIANIDQANLHGVLVNKINLSIPDIGLGQEALLLHGEVEATGKQIKRYVFATPMRQRLSRWRAIDIDDSLNLDIRLDIPLYPESDHVAVLGKLGFDENPVALHLPAATLDIEKVSGALQFNEYGLTDGELRGELDGSPVSLHAQALIQPQEGTVLSIEGQASADYLQDHLPFPWLKLLSGQVNAAALWTIYANEQEPDALHIDTSLQGLDIDLPKPFGKAVNEISPLTVDVHFNPEKTANVKIDYNNQVKGDIFLTTANDHFLFDHGCVHLGQGTFLLPHPNSKGLTITGNLPELDISNWYSTWNTLIAKQDKNQSLNDLKDVYLKIGDLRVLNQKYPQTALKIHRVNSDDWILHVDQADIVCHLHYLPGKHTISGEISRLYLNQIGEDQRIKHRESKWHLQPKDVPNLLLSINDLKVRKIDIGALHIKSLTTPTSWTLEEAMVIAPEYQLRLQGKWSVLNGVEESNLSANMDMNDLGKSLERWHVNPVVHARQGKMTFNGKWKGPFYDFSLSRLSGNAEIVFKNGRISHFDKQTEEKLGLGKLLSILSLQTIPRRLQLDFSDLSEDGYSFDVFKGTFQINQGVMSTKNSYIDGPVAYAKMNGDLDLSKHLYDMNLRITPYITASLPIVATIAGGPIAGVATWVASNLINKGMQQISGYSYKISGPWLDPVVQQVSIERK